MEYIVSRKGINTDQINSKGHYYYNIWSRRLHPYREVVRGDIIYWFDSKDRFIKLITKVDLVERSPFNNESELISFLKANFGEIDPREKYFRDYFANYQKGFCIAYRTVLIKPWEKRLSKLKMPHYGWQTLDSYSKKYLLELEEPIYESNIDDIIDGKDLNGILEALNNAMKNLPIERREQIIRTTVRRDSRIVSELKKAANYKCQFPGCQSQIKTKQGKNYVEVHT